jgi:hypothetical protein
MRRLLSIVKGKPLPPGFPARFLDGRPPVVDSRPDYLTILRSRPGTKIAFFGSPVTNFAID